VTGTGILCLSAIYFDRYELDSLWCLIPLLVLSMPAIRRGVAGWVTVALLLLLGLGSIGATQEYLDWNRARWQAVRQLRGEGVPLMQLDAGYEVNQYLLGSFDAPEPLDRLGDSTIYGTRFVVAFNPLRGYRVVERVPFRGFFGLHRGMLLIEERESRSR
jgi:hypothetical protein